jgi:hypothetical protein
MRHIARRARRRPKALASRRCGRRLPKRLAEIARVLEPTAPFLAGDIGHHAPMGKIIAVDHADGAMIEAELPLVLVRADGEGVHFFRCFSERRAFAECANFHYVLNFRSPIPDVLRHYFEIAKSLAAIGYAGLKRFASLGLIIKGRTRPCSD